MQSPESMGISSPPFVNVAKANCESTVGRLGVHGQVPVLQIVMAKGGDVVPTPAEIVSLPEINADPPNAWIGITPPVMFKLADSYPFKEGVKITMIESTPPGGISVI